MTDGLKAETLRQIYTTLEKCAAVGSQARLRALFVDSRIAQWRGILPEADNLSERVHLLVGRLLERENAQRQSALALFLWVASDDGETWPEQRQTLRRAAQAVSEELGLPPLNLPSIPSVAPTLSPSTFSPPPTAHTPPTYLDFELEISAGAGRLYPVAARSTAGEARETMRFPYDELQLESRLDKLQIALLQAGGPRRRRALTPEEKTVQEFGQALFRALFAGELLSAYRASLAAARRQGKGLRLQLRIADAELAALPWEFLYDPAAANYLCLSTQTPIIRYLELPQPVRPLEVPPPLRILGMIASPAGLPPLDVAREKERLMQATQTLREAGQVEVTWLAGQTWRDLRREMRRGPWHVFHFSGHGGFDENREEGVLALASEQGGERRLYASDLALLLADHAPLRLAVLNACEGGRGSRRDLFASTAATLTQRGIPAVLSMQYPIADWAAIELARSFYEALVDNQPVDAAVAEARKGIFLAQRGNLEWGIPVLHMRSPDGQLFQVAATPPALETEKPATPPPLWERRSEATPEESPQADTRAIVAPPTGETTPPAARTTTEAAPPDIAPAPELRTTAPAGKPAVQTPAPATPDGAPPGEKRIPARKRTKQPALWQIAAQWWLSLPVAGRRALAGVGGVGLFVWLAFALANATPPTPTITPQATRETVEAIAAPPSTATPTPSLTPPPTLGIGSMMTSAVDGMAQMYVPAGPFTMGSDNGGSDEQPVRTVTLDAFWIDQTEVTNDQFAQFVAATSYETIAEEEGGGYTYTSAGYGYTNGADWQHPQGPGSSLDGLGDHPAVLVSWHDAAAYCEWAGRRLPTEAEWEKAARGTDERIYPWGNQLDGNRVNFCDSNCPFDWKDDSIDDGYQFTAPVGSYPTGASPYGALDMAGNVWEWTLSLYEAYPYNAGDGREDLNGTNVRALRGGSWYDLADSIRAAYRGNLAPADRNSNLGFRCAQE